MVFMDYRDYAKQENSSLEAQYPTFLYAMPMSPTKVFFEVCTIVIGLSLYFIFLRIMYELHLEI